MIVDYQSVLAAFSEGNYEPALVSGLMELAEQGNISAQELAGNCYQLGLGMPVDSAKAVYWYEQAIAQGSGLAANNLAGIISRGYEGYPPDRARAQELLDLARALGFDHSPKELLW